MRWTREQLEAAANRFAAGESWGSIGKQYGVDADRMRGACKDRGVRVQAPTVTNGPVVRPDVPASVQAAAGETMGRIARAWPALRPAPLEAIVWIPDVHAPYEDKAAVGLVCEVIEALRPRYVVSLGDFADLHNVSRHMKDPAMKLPVAREIQLAGECRQRIDDACARAGVREKRVTLGNHEDRLRKYIGEKASEMDGLIPTIDKLLGFPQNGWDVIPYGEVCQIGNAFITHDLDRAGKYAHETSRVEMGGATIIGHTHRQALSVGGTYAAGRHFAAMFGWLGDQQYAQYFKKPLRTQWQLGFGVGWLDPATGYITNQLVPIVDGRCVVAGAVYGGEEGRMSRTLWLTLPFGSAEYKVYAADRDDPDLVGDREEDGPCEGATLHDSCAILLRRDLHRKRVPEVLFHEMGHVVAHLSGISTTLRWKLSTEERVVHALSPLFAHGLVGGGLLKLPRFPR